MAARLAESIISDSRRNGLNAEIIEEEVGSEKGTLLSALIHLDGSEAKQFAASYEGTIQWIGYSTFRPGHKRMLLLEKLIRRRSGGGGMEDQIGLARGMGRP